MKSFITHSACSLVLAGTFAICQPIPGQPAGSNATRPSGRLAFDAASIRPSPQDFVLKGSDFLNPSGSAPPPPGGLFSWNVTIPWLINFAYDLRSSQERRQAREALPKWAQDDWFAIEARAEGNPTRNDIRRMVRSLLQDRFQFAGHFMKQQGQVYALTVTSQGSKLKPHAPGAPCTLAPSEVVPNRIPRASPSYSAVPAHCGITGRQLSGSGEHRLEMLDVTTQQIADTLALSLPLSVIDRTALSGQYDAVLDFADDSIPPTNNSSDDIGLPPLPLALEKQLGLTLVKQSAQIDAFVIDHIGPLSEN